MILNPCWKKIEFIIWPNLIKITGLIKRLVITYLHAQRLQMLMENIIL